MFSSGLWSTGANFRGHTFYSDHEDSGRPGAREAAAAQRAEGRARLDTSEARTRRRESKLEDVRAEVEAELEDARTTVHATT